MLGLDVTRRFWLAIILSVTAARPVHGKAAETWWFGAPDSRVPTALRTLKSSHGIYPETLVWSRGGTVDHGLRLVIESDRADRTYRSGDIVALRVGVMNCGSETVGLSCDKGFLQPPINELRVDAPEQVRPPKGLVYIGRDMVELHPKKPTLVSVPPGAVFNPSKDSSYYRSILLLSAPGTYRFWSWISYDGGCSSIESKPFMLVSDTIDVIVRPKRKFLGLF
jgi:hypothetical protein